MTRPKLLLADDSVTIRKVVELTFADEGIDVSTAGDAQSAMQRFVDIQPDIVLVDVGLDGTNGYQICEMIKADEATRHIPVMLLVGSFEPFDGDEAHRVGADAFMTKPFNSIRDLVNRVTMLLSAEQNGVNLGVAQTADLPPPETDDIEDLYKSSFAETAEIENFDTVESFETTDDLLGDAGMDDDMIEASYLTPRNVETPLAAEQAGPVKVFDWSPEAVVGDAEQDFRPSPNEKELDPNEWLEDDENLIDKSPGQSGQFFDFSKDETSVGSEISAENKDEVLANETIKYNGPSAGNPVSLSMASTDDDGDDDDELLDIFDDYNRAVADDPAIHDTIPYAVGEQPPGPIAERPTVAVSDDVIEEIVRRVVHKLSDVVVRDIARVEVPRIAEKLIREALQQESKD